MYLVPGRAEVSSCVTVDPAVPGILVIWAKVQFKVGLSSTRSISKFVSLIELSFHVSLITLVVSDVDTTVATRFEGESGGPSDVSAERTFDGKD